MRDGIMDDGIRSIMTKLSSGTLPENLSKGEVELLIEEYGDNWFFRIGYSEKKYKQPVFE